MQRVIALVTAALLLLAASVGIGAVLPAAPAAPAVATTSAAGFDPGDLISNQNFYNGTGMTLAQIQAFLTKQVGTCTSSNCLANGSFSMGAHAADAMCQAVPGGTGLSAASIIATVGAACGIAPQVIIVTLQKEQSLIQGPIAAAPSSGTLQRAMGYACPDTSNGTCDPAYAGVGNQIYWASWQWKRYGNPPGTSAYFTWLAPGATHAIQYSPNTACGTASVFVQNAATAALYYYTPYTPNAAALANLYGTGDACSTYGNRNFWRLYSDWFGSPTGPVTVMGGLSAATGGAATISVGGWAADGSASPAPVIDITVDGVHVSTTTSLPRPTSAHPFPAVGRAHRFAVTLTATSGTHTVCVVARNPATWSSASLGCTSVVVP